MTDYLKSKFPNYVLTEDTTVVPYKNYFRSDGGRFTRILNPTGNPKTSGYYQFAMQNHNEEFRHYVASHQINNIGTLCHAVLDTLDRYPKWTLPRTTTVGGVTLDWSTSFFDTVWANIGDMPVPDCIVPFSVNFYYAKHLNDLVDKLCSGTSAASLITTFENTATGTSPNLKETYTNNGYVLNPSTLGTEGRADDVYTLMYHWACVDWRTCLMIVQNKTSSTVIPEYMDKCARTMVDLCQKIQYTRIYDAQQLQCKMINVPATINVGGTTFYRLTFTSQLVANATYGEARADALDNIGVYWIRPVQTPASVYVQELMTYDASLTVVDKEVSYMDVQQGQVIYTTVPFSGS